MSVCVLRLRPPDVLSVQRAHEQLVVGPMHGIAALKGHLKPPSPLMREREHKGRTRRRRFVTTSVLAGREARTWAGVAQGKGRWACVMPCRAPPT